MTAPTLLRVALALALPLGASAQETAADAQTRVAAASCAACHGTHGVSRGGIPPLAGVDRAQLLNKLLAYKRGEAPATVMHQHAKGYSDAELERFAAYFAARRP